MPGLLAVAAHIVAADGDASLEAEQAEDAADERGLAGAVGAPERDAVAGGDVERDVVDGDGAAEALGDVAGCGSWRASCGVSVRTRLAAAGRCARSPAADAPGSAAARATPAVPGAST